MVRLPWIVLSGKRYAPKRGSGLLSGKRYAPKRGSG